GFAGADNPVMRPYGSAHPLPLLDDLRVRLLDELPHSLQSLPAPVPELGDSFVDQLRCQSPFRGGSPLFHVLAVERSIVAVIYSRPGERILLNSCKLKYLAVNFNLVKPK